MSLLGLSFPNNTHWRERCQRISRIFPLYTMGKSLILMLMNASFRHLKEGHAHVNHSK